MILPGFEEIIMAIIRETGHSEDTPDEQRYHNVMVALFGKYYDYKDPKIPLLLSHAEMEEILLLEKKGQSLDSAIRSILENKYDEKDPNRDLHIASNVETIRKNIRKNKNHYYWSNPTAFELDEFFTQPEEKKIRDEKIDEIFAALRHAGWPVYREKKS